MTYVLDKSGPRQRLRYDPTPYYKRPDALRSSDFPCYTPQFIPSFERASSHNMYDLLGNEYGRQWHKERAVWAHKMYPHMERSFFQRRYVIRGYHKRCPKLLHKPKHPTKAKFTNVTPRVDARWGQKPPCAAPCSRVARTPVAKPVCSVHRRAGRPCAFPCSCGCGASKPCGHIVCVDGHLPCVCVCDPPPLVADLKNPPSVLKGPRRPCGPRGPGVPRGVVGPAGCGLVGNPPCGPAGAPRDRGRPPREPVCVPSHAEGAHPEWLAPCAGEPPPPCDEAAEVVCQPPCDVVCLAQCAKCGCIKPCPCEKQARETGRGGKCGMVARARGVPAGGQPCPSRLKGTRVCAEPCAEVCHVRAPRREGRGTYMLQLPCPCCATGAAAAGAAPGGDAGPIGAQDVLDAAMARADATAAASAAVAAVGALADVTGAAGDVASAAEDTASIQEGQRSADVIVSSMLDDAVRAAIPE